jgi:hypothetical protein
MVRGLHFMVMECPSLVRGYRFLDPDVIFCRRPGRERPARK